MTPYLIYVRLTAILFVRFVVTVCLFVTFIMRFYAARVIKLVDGTCELTGVAVRRRCSAGKNEKYGHV